MKEDPFNLSNMRAMLLTYTNRDAVRHDSAWTHYGSRPAIRELRKRMVTGLRQVVRQAEGLERGEWADERLPPAQVVCVLVSYGKYFAVRLPWFRDRIRKELEEQGLGGYPFVVLSLEKFDTVVRLTELGVPMDEFFFEAAQENGAAGLILGFTKLNYNACRLGDAQPVTVGFSDAVGVILISNPTVTDRRPNFKFYI